MQAIRTCENARYRTPCSIKRPQHASRKRCRRFFSRRSAKIYAFSYSYDAANNRLAERRESTAGTELESSYYAYDVDNSMLRRRLQVPPSSGIDSYFYYDLNGARIATVEGGAATYFAYAANRMISAIAPPSEAATYFYYDGLLNNYLINKAGTLTYYLWDGLNLLEERNSDGTLKARYTHGYSRLPGIGTILEVQRNVGAATYFQFMAADHRGTVHAVTDANQNTQLKYTMDSFGRQLAAIGGADPNVPNDFIVQTNALTLLIGGVWYLKFHNRLVRIDEGAFMSRDFLPFLNLYRLWSNNPVMQVDADGLASADGSGGKSAQSILDGFVDATAQPWKLKAAAAAQRQLERNYRPFTRNCYTTPNRGDEAFKASDSFKALVYIANTGTAAMETATTGLVVGGAVYLTGPAAPYLAVPLTGLGGYQTGTSLYQSVSGEEAYTFRPLDSHERAQNTGQAIGGIGMLAYGGRNVFKSWAQQGVLVVALEFGGSPNFSTCECPTTSLPSISSPQTTQYPINFEIMTFRGEAGNAMGRMNQALSGGILPRGGPEAPQTLQNLLESINKGSDGSGFVQTSTNMDVAMNFATNYSGGGRSRPGIIFEIAASSKSIFANSSKIGPEITPEFLGQKVVAEPGGISPCQIKRIILVDKCGKVIQVIDLQ